MKNVKGFLSERKGEKAHREAEAMGLKYKGFGYWVDPSTGEVTHKTEGDTLVPVEPDVTAGMADKEKEAPGGAAPGGSVANQAGPGGSFGTFMNKQLPLGTGTNVQDIGPDGMAQAPNTDEGRWEPGPDGDQMVDGQKKGPGMQIKKDAFVSGPNHYGWTAGPDGDNFTTMTVDQIMKKAFSIDFQDYESEVSVAESAWDYLMEAVDQHGNEFTGMNTMVNKLKDGPAPPPRPPEQSVGINQARDALAKMTPSAKQAALQSLGRTPYVSAPAYDGTYEPGEYTKAIKAQRKMWQMPAAAHDNELVKRMNLNAGGLVSDPNFDLSAKGDELGSGAFGQVYESADGNAVIKEGEIGPEELKMMYMMRNNPAFPTLLNAKFDTPFLHQSARERAQPLLDQDTQFDPGDYSEWDKKFPTAKGTYAMSKAKGEPMAWTFPYLNDDQKASALKSLWKARAAMHAAGFAHNDMHGENIFINRDGEDGMEMDDPEVSILDMGLAQDDPLAALMEGLGGLSGQDTQLTENANFKYLPKELQADLYDRAQTVREMIREGFEDPEEAEEADYELDELMEGGIRRSGKDLDALRERFPRLADREGVIKMIKQMYGPLLMSEQEERQSNAFDKLQADSRKIRLANLLRKQRGEKEIEVKNPNVVPPKNLIFDDDD